MEKRLILAVSLSILVLLFWSNFVYKPLDNQEVTTKKSKPVLSISQLPLPITETISFEHVALKVNFIEPQAAIKEVIFKNYQNYNFPLQYGFWLAGHSLNFQKQEETSNSISFIHQDREKKIRKNFVFSNSLYELWLDINFQNLSNQPIIIDSSLILGVLDFSPANIHSRFQDVTVCSKDKTVHIPARKNIVYDEVKFLGLRDRYFCSIIEPLTNSYSGLVRRLNSLSEVSLDIKDFIIEPNQTVEKKYHIYLGPQDLKIINQINTEWSTVIYYGTFDVISQVLLQLLRFIYNPVHNWGLAIVILSVVIYFSLYPLTLKQMRSMKEMQVLQPYIEELRKKYQNNSQKFNKEVMELYKEHKVNPFGGCLPLILQMPIFFALYQTLMRSVVLRGAGFLWIKDLSEPDRLFLLPFSLPIIGNEVNILPIVMAIGMFVQQRVSMKTTPTSNQEQQRIMMILFPLMFGFIFYRMPSGLVLYWFVNSTLMLIYQLRIHTSTSQK
ncbi:MAG: membrane protein insertase YidC [Candidatus Omnitrophica bacterium]|nr:membrane protein insertase YidC [Candidatus Omnitrophota bacterium]